MTESPLGRIVEIAEVGRHLAKDRGFLIVSSSGAEIGRVPLDDLSAVIVSAPGTTVSCFLLSDLASRGISFAVCGQNFAPAGLLWPVDGHHVQQRRMEGQINSTKVMARKIWTQVVVAKIRWQGWAVSKAGHRSGAFESFARAVKAGDPENIEAQAARRYWPLMFGPDFRRDTEAPGTNALLNYGYAILRSATARAIAAAGLHPGMGVFHRHPHNAMPLADDLMEPFRPHLDLEVLSLTREGLLGVDKDAKRRLVGVLLAELPTSAGNSPIQTCLMRLAQSVAASYVSGEISISLPRFPAHSWQETVDEQESGSR